MELDAQYVLTFEATLAEPPLEDIFLASGGQINAAAGRGETDFAVSGAEFSESYRLVDSVCQKVSLQVPNRAVQYEDGIATLHDRMMILVSNTRVGAAIQGSGVGTFAERKRCSTSMPSMSGSIRSRTIMS